MNGARCLYYCVILGREESVEHYIQQGLTKLTLKIAIFQLCYVNKARSEPDKSWKYVSYE